MSNVPTFIEISYDNGEKLSLYRPGKNLEMLRTMGIKANIEQNKTGKEGLEDA